MAGKNRFLNAVTAAAVSLVFGGLMVGCEDTGGNTPSTGKLAGDWLLTSITQEGSTENASDDEHSIISLRSDGTVSTVTFK